LKPKDHFTIDDRSYTMSDVRKARPRNRTRLIRLISLNEGDCSAKEMKRVEKLTDAEFVAP